MSWQEQNALKRIFNVFKRNKTNVYQEDINALKTLNESLEAYQKQFVNDNKLFAKLLSIQIMQNVRYCGSIETALKLLKDDLKKPIEYNLEILKTELNNTEVNNYLKSIQEISNNETIIFNNQKEIIDKILKSWSLENIEKSFYNTANEIIKNIDFYK
jgi:hypothetical protein